LKAKVAILGSYAKQLDSFGVYTIGPQTSKWTLTIERVAGHVTSLGRSLAIFNAKSNFARGPTLVLIILSRAPHNGTLPTIRNLGVLWRIPGALDEAYKESYKGLGRARALQLSNPETSV
jgi:hypothetical protein